MIKSDIFSFNLLGGCIVSYYRPGFYCCKFIPVPTILQKYRQLALPVLENEWTSPHPGT
jgi:hypothetical protein